MNTEEIIEYIKRGKNYFQKNDVDGFYGSIPSSYESEITQFLLTKTSINILKYMSTIPRMFLRGATQVASIVIPGNIKTIETGAFAGSTIETVQMESGVKTLEKSCFQNCKNLRAIDLSDTIKSIPAYCFEGCENLEKVFLPDSIEIIGEHAFDGCDKVELIANHRGKNPIRARKSDLEFFKKHLKFEHPEKQTTEETEEE